MCNCNLENEHAQLKNIIVSILYCCCDERKNHIIWQTTRSRSWFPMEIILVLISLLLNYNCLFRKPPPPRMIKFNPFKGRCFEFLDIVFLFADLIRESGNWGKLWEWSKFNRFKRRCFVYFWIFFVCLL